MPNGKQLLVAPKPTLMVNEMKNDFALLGTGVQAPPTNRAQDEAAWEYAVATELLRAAKTRKDRAQRAAVDLGVLPDVAKEPRDPGNNEIVYEGTWVQVQLRVNQPVVGVDMSLFEQALRDRKVKQSVIDECKAAAQKSSKPAHQFSAVFRSTRNEALTGK
jgi:hypothetical protein